MIETRWSTAQDAPALARVHQDAWRFAYSGLLPGVALERWITGRGAPWWESLHRSGGKALVVELDGRLCGYATGGRCRDRRSRRGEIYELYLDPVCHGAGLGARLFREARRRLEDRALRGLVVWSLAENEAGCRFYRAVGGRVGATGTASFHGARLDRLGFIWS